MNRLNFRIGSVRSHTKDVKGNLLINQVFHSALHGFFVCFFPHFVIFSRQIRLMHLDLETPGHCSARGAEPMVAPLHRRRITAPSPPLQRPRPPVPRPYLHRKSILLGKIRHGQSVHFCRDGVPCRDGAKQGVGTRRRTIS